MGLEFPKPSPVAGYNPEFLKRVHERQRLERERRAAERELELRRQRIEQARLVSIEEATAKRLATQKAICRVSACGGPQFLRIATRICLALDVSPAELFAPTRRNTKMALARHAICYWAARLTDLSYPRIGKALGRDHTTVLHGKDAYVEKRRAQGRYLRPAR